MSKPPTTHPGQIPNDEKAVFLKHLSVALLDNEERDRVNKRRNRNRKLAKADNIEVGDMDQAIKMADWSPSDIAKFFTRKIGYLGHMNIDVPAQFNLFGGADPAPKKGVDFYPVGLYAGLRGKDGTPPQNLAQADSQRWIDGWGEGQALRVQGMAARAEADALVKDPGGADSEDDDDDRDDESGPPEGLLRVALSEFGPDAKLEDIELADLDQEEVQKALQIEVYDGENVRVLKTRDGPKGSPEDGSSPAALKKTGAARTAAGKAAVH